MAELFKNKYVILALLLTFVLSNILFGLFRQETLSHSQSLFLESLVAILQLAALIQLLAFGWRSPSTDLFKKPSRARKGGIRSMVFLALACLAGGAAISLAVHTSNEVFWRMGGHYFLGHRFQTSERYITAQKGRVWFPILFLPVTVLLEEYLFRKCLLSLCVKNKVPGAGLVAALVFTVYHTKSDLNSFLIVFGLGLALNWVYLRTGSVWLAALLHYSYDAMVLYGWPGWKVHLGAWYWVGTWLWGLGSLWVLKQFLEEFSRKNVRRLKPERRPGPFSRFAWSGTAYLLFFKTLVVFF